MTFFTYDECEDEYNKKTRGIFRPVHRPLLSIEALISRKAEGVSVGNFPGIVQGLVKRIDTGYG